MAVTQKQRRAVELLYEGKMNAKQIAHELNVSEQTMSKWRKRPDFQAELNRYGSQYISKEVPLLIKNMFQLAFKSRSDMVRLQATMNLLEKVSDTQELESKEQVVIVNDIPQEKQ